MIFPKSDSIEYSNFKVSPHEVIEKLSPLLTSQRKELIEKALPNKTYTVCPVVEGLYDLGNISAVLRSAESLGYQSLHIIKKGENFKHSKRTSNGAEKWLDIYKWERTKDCFDNLKSQGYRVVVTDLEGSIPINEVDFTQPTAVVLGNEKEGVSEEAKTHADLKVKIPMLGFSQSFNISVAAALILYHAQQDRIRRTGSHGDLNPKQIERLRAEYYLRCKLDNPTLLKNLFNTKKNN